MVSCQHCSTPNSIDSAFCKRCGTALPETDLQDAKLKLDALISEGNIAFGEGRINEAMAIATSALESNPSSVDAMVLKSLCYERTGNIADALEYAEKVVDLNPDSELDKIRRNGLRSALGNTLHVPERSDKKGPIFAALAATLFVLSLGAAYVHFTTTRQTPVAELKTVSDPVVPFGTQAGSTTGNQPTQPNPASTQTPPPAAATQNSNSGQQSEAPDAAEAVRTPPFPRVGSALPYAGPQTGVVNLGEGTRPVVPVFPSGQRSTVAQGGNDPTPTPDQPGDTAAQTNPPSTAVTQAPPAEDPGQIEIRVSSGSRRPNVGGTQSITPSSPVAGNGVEALFRTGNQQFLIGSYGPAANSFERALRGGGDPIRINQLLGQTYEKLGRTSDAASAYTRAVNACKAALDSGRGDKSRIEATLASCQAAGKVLGG